MRSAGWLSLWAREKGKRECSMHLGVGVDCARIFDTGQAKKSKGKGTQLASSRKITSHVFQWLVGVCLRKLGAETLWQLASPPLDVCRPGSSWCRPLVVA
jgi:hypothetical protein